MAQDLDFFLNDISSLYGSTLRFFLIRQIMYITLGLKLEFFFQVYVNDVECKKHQYPIQKALRAKKKHAPPQI